MKFLKKKTYHVRFFYNFLESVFDSDQNDIYILCDPFFWGGACVSLTQKLPENMSFCRVFSLQLKKYQTNFNSDASNRK